MEYIVEYKRHEETKEDTIPDQLSSVFHYVQLHTKHVLILSSHTISRNRSKCFLMVIVIKLRDVSYWYYVYVACVCG